MLSPYKLPDFSIESIRSCGTPLEYVFKSQFIVELIFLFLTKMKMEKVKYVSKVETDLWDILKMNKQL